MSSIEQLVRISLPAGVSSLRFDPSFILPKSSPGRAYLAVDAPAMAELRR